MRATLLGTLAMANGGMPRCIAQADEGWRKPCRNLADLDDDDDVPGAIHLLGGVVAAVRPLLHLAGASKRRLMCSESIAPGAQGDAHLHTSSSVASKLNAWCHEL